MAGKAKKILSVIIVLAAAGAVAGYYLWNKPHQDIAGATGTKVVAADLYKAFTTDSSAAKQLYIQQVLEVSGIVSNISKNQQNQALVLVKTGVDGAYINCTMEGPAAGIKEGASVAIKGICNGIGQGDSDLGIMGDVYLVRAYLAK